MTETPALDGLGEVISTPTPTAELVERVFASADLRPSTRATYRHAAKTFIEWVGTRPLDPTVLAQYKKYLRERTDLSAKTKNLYLAAVRSVFRQLFALGVLPFDASRFVKAFTISNGHRRPPITDAQVAKAFAAVRRQNDQRLELILNLLYRQGLRQKEVVDLEVEHFDEHAATLLILGKGRDDRELVHLHPETVAAFVTFLNANERRTGYVFPSRKVRGGHLTTAMLYRLVCDHHRRCGISNTPHSWRKVFASKLIESGMSLLDVQAYTRHRSVEQLKVYYDRLSLQKTLPTFYATFASQAEGAR